jgi:alanyl-tRNA synthetase
MKTHRIYYDDAYVKEFDARIMHCEVLPPDVNSGITAQVWGLVLDRTAFYPTSGGQPNDLGKVGDANVLDVRDDGDEIIHIVDRKPSSPDVLGCINWPRRFDHMQQHSGQHLLSAMFLERYGRPTVSFHLGAELCTIDVSGPEPSDEILEGAERAANKIIFEDRPLTVRYGTAEDLAELGVRKEVDRAGILRAIEIEGADLQPCGGTHVKSTGQIGTLLLRRCTKMRQDWRLEFVCGVRAGRAARQDFLRIRATAEKLSCAPEELVAAAVRSVSERDANHKKTRVLLQRLAESEAGQAVLEAAPNADGLFVVHRVFEDGEPEFLGHFATHVARTEKSIALVADLSSGNVLFAQHLTATRDMNALLKQVLTKFGGKGGGTRDFARGRLDDPTNAPSALTLAQDLLSGNQPSL